MYLLSGLTFDLRLGLLDIFLPTGLLGLLGGLMDLRAGLLGLLAGLLEL